MQPEARGQAKFRGRASAALIGTVFALCLLCPVAALHAREGDGGSFIRFGVDEGLPSSTVYGLVQDEEGYLWISGATGGLARFDGNRFVQLPLPASAADGRPLPPDTGVMRIDRRGRLWVGSWGQGLFRVDADRQTVRRFTAADDPIAGLHSDRIQSLHLDAGGDVWIGTTGGLARIGEDDRVERLSGVPGGVQLIDPRVWAIQGDESELWIAASDGLYHHRGREIGTRRLQPFARDAGDRSNEIRALQRGGDGALWLGTRQGLVRFDPDTEYFDIYDRASTDAGTLEELPAISALAWLGDHELLLGTREGVYRFRTDTRQFVAYSEANGDIVALPSADVRQFLLDRSGALWIASRDAGLFQTSPLRQQFSSLRTITRQLSPQMLRSSVTAVHLDPQGVLWAASNVGVLGVTVATGEVVQLSNRGGVPIQGAVTGIVSLHDALWIGTEAGLYRRPPGGGGFVEKIHALAALGVAAPSVRALRVSAAGDLLLGLWGDGLLAWDPRTSEGRWLLRDFSKQAGDAVFDVAEAADGSIWVGTRYSGVFQIDRSGQRLQRLQAEDGGLPSDSVHALRVGSDGDLWIGTDRGLVRRGADGASTHYSSASGLADDKVVGIGESADGILWILTKRGLTRMAADASMVSFGRPDGLAGSELNRGAVHVCADGKVYVGSVEGLNFFDPARLKVNRMPPPVVVSQVLVDNLPVAQSADSALVVPDGARSLQVEFAALDYHDVARNRFRYRLKGYDTDWQQSGTRPVAVYTSLPPGRYDFEVMGSNSHGVWSEAPVGFGLEVRGPWWRYPQWQVSFALALVLMSAGIYRYRVGSLQRARVALQRKVEEYAGELRDERDLLLRTRRQAEQLKSTLDSTQDAVLVFVADTGACVYANHGAAALLRKPIERLLGRRLVELMAPGQADAVGELAQQLAVAGGFQHVESACVAESGGTVPVQMFLQYIAPPGEGPRFLAILSDITERKRVERMKSEFISTVSHELRTPLTSISGALSLLESGSLGALPEQGRRVVELASRNSRRLAMLINDLLDMEKIVAGKMQLEISEQPLLSIVRQAVEANLSYADKYGVTLRLNDAVGEVWVKVDELRLQQVLANLLSNAIKYSPTGGEVVVRVERDGDICRVCVVDRGNGIPQAFQSRLFEKFSQADASDAREKGGTGLGLAIAKELVERMEGRIGFRSQQGVGTTFWVEFVGLGPLGGGQQSS